MPEGDTVFLIAHRLHEALVGEMLTGGEIRHPRLSTIDLSGWRIVEVVAVGKHLLLRFGNERSLHSHLRMDGAWHIYRPGASWRGPRRDVRIVLRSENRVVVGFRLHDMELLRRKDEGRLIAHLGPDLLDEGWNEHSRAEVLRRMPEHTPLGQVLLDQRVVAGIGNVYLAEICFRTGLSPFVPVSDMDMPTRARVIDMAHGLLHDNRYRAARTTTGDRRPGRRHWVYQRQGHPCRHCGTLIRRAPLGVPPRDTWFCPRCQPPPVAGV